MSQNFTDLYNAYTMRSIGVFHEFKVLPGVLPSNILHCVTYRVKLYRDISRVYNSQNCYRQWLSWVRQQDITAASVDLDLCCHYDVIKWKHLPRYWPFVRGIHRSPVNSQHKGQWRGALMFSLICTWVNNGEAGDLRRYRTHYDVIAMALWLH